jgi:osmotically-inducible protein OsmY
MLRQKITTLLFILTISTVLSIGCGVTKKMDVTVLAEANQDRIVTSAIQASLAKQSIASKIDVETSQGNVTLSGIVANPAEGDRVIQSALSVDGVRRLSPNLTVK